MPIPPSVDEFLRRGLTTRGPRNPPPSGTDCMFCAEQCSAQGSGDKTTVQIKDCDHSDVYFHKGCLETWFRSTADNRDLCPICRKELLRPDPLTRQQVRELEEEDDRQVREIAREIMAEDRDQRGGSFGEHDFGGHEFGGHDFGEQDFGDFRDFGVYDFGGHGFGGRGHDFGGHDFGGPLSLPDDDLFQSPYTGASGARPSEDFGYAQSLRYDIARASERRGNSRFAGSHNTRDLIPYDRYSPPRRRTGNHRTTTGGGRSSVNGYHIDIDIVGTNRTIDAPVDYFEGGDLDLSDPGSRHRLALRQEFRRNARPY